MGKNLRYGVGMRSQYNNPSGLIKFAGWMTRQISPIEWKIKEYKNYYLSKVEIIDRSRLSSAQRLLLQRDENFASGPLYMVTACKNEFFKKAIKERELFVNAEQLKKMRVEKVPIGNGLQIIEKKGVTARRFLFATLGQFWWNMRPRTQYIISAIGKIQDIETINDMLLNCPKHVNRSPLIGHIRRNRPKL